MLDASEPKWTPPEGMISRCVEAYDNADPDGDGTDEGMRAAISASGLPALMAAAGPILGRYDDALRAHGKQRSGCWISEDEARALADAYKLAKGEK